MSINRREFLKGLAGLGASIAIPVSIADWTGSEVDEAWYKAVADPFEFEVDEYGSISTPGWELPDTNGEAYELELGEWSTGEDLVAVASCAAGLEYAMACAFQVLVDDANDLLEKSGRAALSGAEERVLELHDELGEEGWTEWLKGASEPELQYAAREIQFWLDEGFDANDLDGECLHIGPYAGPYSFFSGLDREELDTLGVKIVDGDRPGSSYFAAELHEDLDEANRIAAEIGLPVRFCQA